MANDRLILHPDIDPGIDWSQIALLDELDAIGRRLAAIEGREENCATDAQRMAFRQAQSAYLRQFRKTLSALAESGFNEGGRDRFYTEDELTL